MLFIIKSVNSGTTWETPIIYSCKFRSISVFNNIVYAIGEGTILKLTNDVPSFQTVFGVLMNAVATSGDIVYGVGFNGYIVTSIDGGVSWNRNV